MPNSTKKSQYNKLVLAYPEMTLSSYYSLKIANGIMYC